VDAAALGNHEFDWGRDTLRALVREGPYSMLAANVRTAGGGRLPGIDDDTLIVRAGLRIGVVGLATPETPSTTRAANVKGLTFGPMAPAFDARARALRARGADVVVAVAHSGAFCDRAPARPAPAGPRADSGAPAAAPAGCRGEIVDFANAVTERLDAVVSGHTHSLVDTRVRGVPVVQARSSGRALGVVDLVLDPATGAPIPDSTRTEVREVAGAGDDAPAPVQALVREAVAAVAGVVNRPVAEIAEPMRREPDEQYALGNLVADAQRWAGRGDVAVTNNGGIRADLRAGRATYGTLFEVQPFGNLLARVTVRGRDLRGYVERLVARERPRVHVSGLAVEFDPSRPEGERVTAVRMADGRPVDDARLYTVILNDFLVTGGDGLGLAERAASVTALNVVDLDAFVGYLRQLPQPVRAPSEVRLRAARGAPAPGAGAP
jgi:5'-nucleotidase